MAESWRLKGDWFDVCRCRVPCPCTFAQAPDEDQCDGILAWHITEPTIRSEMRSRRSSAVTPVAGRPALPS